MRNAGNAISSGFSIKGLVRTPLRKLANVMASVHLAFILSVVAIAIAVSGCKGTDKSTEHALDNTAQDAEAEELKQPYQRSRALIWLGRYGEAEIYALEAVELAKVEFGPTNANTALRLRVLARVYHAQERLGEAESSFDQVLAIFEETLRPDDPDIADTLNRLAEVYDAQDRVTEAEMHYARSIAIAENWGRLISPDIYNNLAENYRKQNRYAEAEAVLKRYLSIPESTREGYFQGQSLELLTLFGASSPYAAEGWSLAERYLSTQKMAKADGYFARGHFLLASLYQSEGKYAEAEPLYERSLAITEKAHGSEHPLVATVLESYAALLQDTDRHEAAAEMESRANAIRAKHR